MPTPPTIAPPGPTGRYTPFGWRLGFADGPWERQAELVASNLYPNPVEQELLRCMLLECDGSGASAHTLALVWNALGVWHPRLGTPWKAGSIAMVYKNHQRRLLRHQQDVAKRMFAQALRHDT